MVFATNLKQGIDLPVVQWLRPIPQTAYTGACMVTDERGSSRYIYILNHTSSTSTTANFWRYDVYTNSFEKLKAPGRNMSNGTCMVFDPSQGASGRIWALIGTGGYFQYYDIATNTWTSRTALAGTGGTNGSMTHTCSTYNALGNDDYIYWIGNGSTPFYRYSITGDSWTVMANALPANSGVGASLHWVWGFDTDKIYAFRGGSSSTIYIYSIGVPGWTTLTYYPAEERAYNGACAVYDGANRIYWTLVDENLSYAQQRCFRLQLDESLNYPVLDWPGTPGDALEGKNIAYIVSPDSAPFLYYRKTGSVEFWRSLIFV